MSFNLTYAGRLGTLDLDVEDFNVGTALGIRARQWAYTLGRASISGVSRQAVECSVSAMYGTSEIADEARRVFDADVSSLTPGLLTSGGWSQRAYVTKQTPQTRYHGSMTAELTVILLDGSWYKPHTVSFLPYSNVSDYGKMYSFGYEYDYAPSAPARTLEVPGIVPSPFRLVIWGRAVNPSVTIGGNLYNFAVTVPAGGYLLVDTLYEPVVEMVTADGIRSDVFDAAERGGGEGSGTYAFQRIEPGSNLVAWDDSFGFDLTTYQLEGELPWTSS